MDAFDADVLIYAAVRDHPLGRRVLALLPSGPTDESGEVGGVGSVMLIPEVLARPIREGDAAELAQLVSLLGRLELRALDESIAFLATSLGAAYGLRAADSVHLATAVDAGAERFITNNATDFSKRIVEIDITYPAELDDTPS